MSNNQACGNGAAIRDALRNIDNMCRHNGHDFGNPIVVELLEQLDMIRAVAKAALAEPARNCERFNSPYDAIIAWGCEDQGWDDWPDEDAEDENDLINMLSADQKHELIDWLFAKAEGNEK